MDKNSYKERARTWFLDLDPKKRVAAVTVCDPYAAEALVRMVALRQRRKPFLERGDLTKAKRYASTGRSLTKRKSLDIDTGLFFSTADVPSPPAFTRTVQRPLKGKGPTSVVKSTERRRGVGEGGGEVLFRHADSLSAIFTPAFATDERVKDADLKLERGVRLCDTETLCDTVTVSPFWLETLTAAEDFLRTMEA